MPKNAKGKGKTKNEKKDTSKFDMVLAEAEANTSLWEDRLTASEKQNHEYKQTVHRLLMENHALQTSMKQAEWEMIDAVNLLKKQEAEREDKAEVLQKQVTELKVQQQEKIETLTFKFHNQINELEDKLNDKRKEAEAFENKFERVQKFLNKKLEMEKEIQDLKTAAESNHIKYQNDLAQCEKKFLEEKYQLKQESSQKIAELAKKAHEEAILNLNDTTKLVYKENARLTEALKYHIDAAEILAKEKENYIREQDNLKTVMKEQKTLLHKKVIQIKKLRKLNSKLSMKIDILEESLHDMMKQFENQRTICMKESGQQIEVYKAENERLKQIIGLKTKGMNKVKRLARNILEQRTELETFFIEGINYVKTQIMQNQANYINHAKLAYQNKMLEANSGKTHFPKVRTFNKAQSSTNDVHDDFETAAVFSNIDKDIAISDLTWEQKERVLRYMFAKMNGYAQKSSPPASNLALPSAVQSKKLFSLTDSELQPSNETFLTQPNFTSDTLFTQQDLIPAS